MAITRTRFRELLGFAEPEITLLSRREEAADGYAIEHVRLLVGGVEVRGILTRPVVAAGRLPAILYGHSHGGGYHIGARELLDGRDYLLDPLGPVLARAGYVTLCIDMPIFGERAQVKESFAAKALLWHGKSLFGQMLSEHAAALTYLAERDDVDAGRIGAFGISMGCVLSYWLAALDERIAAVAHLCCFADFRTMIELGAHDGHGIYLTVPGLLREADGGSIAALIAPRPQLICVGEADALTPKPAVARALEELRHAYAAMPERLQFLGEEGVGHRETPTMRAAMLEFFARYLG
ncbi:dienelactone hydrolase family protein [Devosia sp. YIM 151766]|uniref:alpha/beta hydrolase family protein n=1 Tax=Devosia sp. YIM 151766 TaxID=3017325 RepID=UPI00255CD210|nr:dienelactone hydrolase family protein [Devosia sp. YIM 151766]WIY51692.1 dienelactone hydrolase family protein [Devosia sp. YIM 151766]